MIELSSPNGGYLNIDMWYGDKFEPMMYGADAYFSGSDYVYRGNIYNDQGKVIGDYESDDSSFIGKNFLIDWEGSSDRDSYDKINDTITGATDISDEQVKFFYEGKFLGACDPNYFECDKLYDIMKSDKVLSDLILEYLNSFGDPIYSISDEEWSTPETDSSKIDTYDLYNTFMDWLEFQYREEGGEDFYEDISVPRSGKHTLEIFTGAVADDVDISSASKINAAKEHSEPNADVMKLVNQFFKEAEALVDYFRYHNKNLNSRQDELIENLSDAINSRSTIAAREAIENLKYNTKRMNNEQSYKVEELYCELCCAGGKYQGLGRSYKEDSVTGSTKYGADMCSIGASVDEDGKFYVAGYLGDNYRGLMSDLYSDDFEEILSVAADMSAQGLFIEITNRVDGRSERYTPEDFEIAAENGEYPYHIREDLAL